MVFTCVGHGDEWCVAWVESRVVLARLTSLAEPAEENRRGRD